jgi:DNA polymerase-3 subunit alpha
MIDFCHLHCHTHFSLLDGAARIRDLVVRSSELGMPALAITDHGNLFGVPEFYTEADRAGIKPIIGCEFYLTSSSMSDRTDRKRYHQVLLAKNEQGYRNLIALSSKSFTDGYYYKPRIDLEVLRQHREGLVATTCCLQGHVPQTLLTQGEDEARRIFEMYLDLFGEDYYVEVQDHGIDDQKRCNETLLRWSRDYGVGTVATNDVHYVEQADAEAQDVLLCLQTNRDYYDPKRMRFENDQFFLKSGDEMDLAFADLEPTVRQAALSGTVAVADKCSFKLRMGDLLMPHFPIPAEFGEDMDAYLRHLVFDRARSRYGEMSQTVVERLEHELGIIKSMGYAGYFLIVQDFTTAARDLGVAVGPGRGSAAGSAVAYSLGVTNIDPLRYDLLFERFLNPERVSMPDIDIDFDDRGRGKVIDYVVQKYGRESVCQIITFGTMGARSVIRDVSRVLGIPLPEADRIAKLVPEGVRVSIDSAIRDVPEFRQLQKSDDEQIRRLIRYARVLEGSARHTGVHAAGVIIAPGNVSDYVPVALAKGKAGGDDVVTTQYDGKWVEYFGLLKMDFLGLKTLTVLGDALRLIRENHGLEIDLDAIPMDCDKTFDLFRQGRTVAIFQFESEGMREWMLKLRPTSIDDLIAMNALYRPGPMDLIPNYVARKHGREDVTFPHPLLEPILSPTYGIPVYQEQVMEIARVMAGYTLGQADILRRAMGKKKQSEMDKQRVVFVRGAMEREVPEKSANEVFDMMAKFAGYGFNKSHSAAYSIVAYQTAYLKAHYPAEFMAAAMTNEMGDIKKLSVVLEEARRLGLEVLPPSVNRSQAYFTVEEGCIRFGLGAIKGVGLGAIESILDSRAKDGPFTTLFSLAATIDLRSVNKKALECLACAGALTDLDGHRAQQVAAVELAVQYAQRVQSDRAAGQNSLFGGGADEAAVVEPPLPTVEPWSKARMLKEERELIGVYVSGHPLEAYRAEVRAFATAELGGVDAPDVPRQSEDDRHGLRPVLSFCGIITEVQQRRTKTGRPIAFATLEDYTGQGELVCFSTVLDRVQNYLTVDEIVLVRGHVELRGGGVKVIVQDILPMWKVREQLVRSIVLRVDPSNANVDQIRELRSLCDANRGQCKLYFDIAAPELKEVPRVHSRTFVVDANAGISRIFGSENVVLEGEA